MKYFRLFLVAIVSLVATRCNGSGTPFINLQAAHAIGMLAENERPVSVWVYFKNVSDRTIKFPIDFDAALFQKGNRKGIALSIARPLNPLKQDIIVSPRDFQLVDIPPHKSLIVKITEKMEIDAKSRFWVRLFIPEDVGSEFGMGEVRLDCESIFTQ